MVVQGAKVYSGLYNGNIQACSLVITPMFPSYHPYSGLYNGNIQACSLVIPRTFPSYRPYPYPYPTPNPGVAHGRLCQPTLGLAARVPHPHGPHRVHLLPAGHGDIGEI